MMPTFGHSSLALCMPIRMSERVIGQGLEGDLPETGLGGILMSMGGRYGGSDF